MVRKSLNTHGTLLVYLLCRLLTVGCFQKNRFGEIVNSGSQNNSTVQSTLRHTKTFMTVPFEIGHCIIDFTDSSFQLSNSAGLAIEVTVSF